MTAATFDRAGLADFAIRVGRALPPEYLDGEWHGPVRIDGKVVRVPTSVIPIAAAWLASSHPQARTIVVTKSRPDVRHVVDMLASVGLAPSQTNELVNGRRGPVALSALLLEPGPGVVVFAWPSRHLLAELAGDQLVANLRGTDVADLTSIVERQSTNQGA